MQVSLLQQQLELRRQRGEVKKNAAGEVVDRESRLLLHHINTMMRPIQFDEEETKALQESEERYLRLALDNYHRCCLHKSVSCPARANCRGHAEYHMA